MECRVCRKSGATKVCAKCKSARYCGVECQREDWREHRKRCFRNPLFEWAKQFAPQTEQEVYSMLKDNSHMEQLIVDLKKRLGKPHMLQWYPYMSPCTFARSNVATSLIDIDAILQIKHFSPNLHVIDMGCGSGYNAWLLRQVGLCVTAVDVKSTYFKHTFIGDIQYEMPEITDKMAGGVLLYIWPTAKSGFPGLEAFLAKGGKRVIVGGDFRPDHCYEELPVSERPPICPLFPPSGNWHKVKTMQMPVYGDDMEDTLQFFVLE